MCGGGKKSGRNRRGGMWCARRICGRKKASKRQKNALAGLTSLSAGQRGRALSSGCPPRAPSCSAEHAPAGGTCESR